MNKVRLSVTLDGCRYCNRDDILELDPSEVEMLNDLVLEGKLELAEELLLTIWEDWFFEQVNGGFSLIDNDGNDISILKYLKMLEADK